VSWLLTSNKKIGGNAMAIMKYNWPKSGLTKFDRDLSTTLFSDLFDDFFMNDWVGGPVNFRPTLDVAETSDAFEIEVTLPGVKKENLDVSLEDNRLTISGERKWDKNENKKYHKMESGYGKFRRSFVLPESIDEDSIEARYEDGILYLTIAKSEETTGRHIEIK